MTTTQFDSLLKQSVATLKAGRSGRVVGIHAEHLSAKRLADMGFITGAKVRMIRRGNPCIVGIGGTFVGLGVANQKCVLVDADEDVSLSLGLVVANSPDD